MLITNVMYSDVKRVEAILAKNTVGTDYADFVRITPITCIGDVEGGKCIK